MWCGFLYPNIDSITLVFPNITILWLYQSFDVYTALYNNMKMYPSTLSLDMFSILVFFIYLFTEFFARALGAWLIPTGVTVTQ